MISFKSGAIVNVTVRYFQLDIQMSAPGKFKGQVKGLYGNYNGDREDDLMKEDGSTIPVTSTSKEIFHYGKTWRVKPEHSLFYYDQSSGESYADFEDDSFEPVFSEDLKNNPKRSDAEKFCKKKNNDIDDACVYDYLVTGDTNLAGGTKEAAEESDDLHTLSSNNLPTITGPKSMQVSVCGTSSITLEINDVDEKDKDSLQMTFDGNLPNEAQFVFDKSTRQGVFTWKPTKRYNAVVLSFIGVDGRGLKANSFIVKVKFCDCSCDHGVCRFEQLQEGYNETQLFQYVQCECNPYYSGIFCEDDFDACNSTKSVACGEGRQCTDLTAEEHKQLHQTSPDSPGYTCTDCSDGFEEVFEKCQDIDECNPTVQANPCSQICKNSMGSFICECNEGYRLSTAIDCQDIDECTMKTDDCQQICTNINGGYKCSCDTGFTLNADEKTCSPNTATTTACSAVSLNCGPTNVGYCRAPSGTAECACIKGYTLSGTTCNDDDECGEAGLCDSTNNQCTNTAGSYQCSCKTGYRMNSAGVCEGCKQGYWGDNCEQLCRCGTGSGCDAATGCTSCPSGWTGGSCDQNINECATRSSPCGSNSKCTDLQGSFKCECNEWYEWKLDKCERVDACKYDKTSANTLSTPRCENDGFCEKGTEGAVGTFVCQCIGGYTGAICDTDINDCNPNPCQNGGTCADKVNGYECSCFEGFFGTNCQNNVDDCSPNPCENGGTCTDKLNGFECLCVTGFIGKQCENSTEIPPKLGDVPVYATVSAGVAGGILCLVVIIQFVHSAPLGNMAQMENLVRMQQMGRFQQMQRIQQMQRMRQMRRQMRPPRMPRRMARW